VLSVALQLSQSASSGRALAGGAKLANNIVVIYMQLATLTARHTPQHSVHEASGKSLFFSQYLHALLAS
jgi:long-subunit fatty acid transport protein